MRVYVLVTQTSDDNIEECKVCCEREIATDNLIGWAEDNNIILDTENTESEIYFDTDEEGDYISRIIDENAGQITMFLCETESY